MTSSPKHDRHPRWSPDGKWIAFESNRGGKFQIYLIRADGGEAKELTSISTEAQQAVWSPDGKGLVFVSAVFPEFSAQPFKESDAANKKKEEEREKSKVKGRVITKLLYRHWDSWVDDKRQHLFVLDLDRIGLLDEGNQLDEAGRIQDVTLHEGGVICNGEVATHHEVIEQKFANHGLDVLHISSTDENGRVPNGPDVSC